MEIIAEKIFKIKGNSNIYLIKENKNILIDTGSPLDKRLVEKEINELCGCENIHIVIFTHLHYDHVANWNLFSNAIFYASRVELQDYIKDANKSVLKEDIAQSLKEMPNLNPIENRLESLKIIPTPGHTQGSISIMHQKKKVLFTGDTYFGPGLYGRVDLPTSNPNAMADSLNIINRLKDLIICPGHDY
jgi:glyoxylase-like metal-dependent hydrolase (beta-lactamase superfamily II)